MVKPMEKMICNWWVFHVYVTLREGMGFVSEWNIPSPLVNHHISHWIAILGASSFFRQTHRSEPWLSIKNRHILSNWGQFVYFFSCNFRAKHCCCWYSSSLVGFGAPLFAIDGNLAEKTLNMLVAFVCVFGRGSSGLWLDMKTHQVMLEINCGWW